MLIIRSLLFQCSCCGAVLRHTAGWKLVPPLFCLSTLFQLLLPGNQIQYGCFSCLNSALVNGQLFMLYAISVCNCSLSCVTYYISCICMHSVQVFIALILRFMPEISSFLFSECFVITASPQHREWFTYSNST